MNKRFDFISTTLKDLYKVDRKIIQDHRGLLSRLFCVDHFKEIGFNKSIVQINHTLTQKKGVIRGMHYQNPPYTETKIVTCIQGKILDVAVDLRQGSSTFLKWHSEILSSDNQSSLFIPDGFAHGFQTLTEDCHIIYMHSNFFSPDAEEGLNPVDPKIAIRWPLDVTEVSKKDNNYPMLDDSFKGITIV